MIFFRKLHKWLGLVIGLQVFIWIVTGTIISLLDAQVVSGRLTRQAPFADIQLAQYQPLIPLVRLPVSFDSVRSVQLTSLFTQPVYLVKNGESHALYDALTGLELLIDATVAERIARASYSGEGQFLGGQKLEQGSDEVRGASGALWKMDFDDALATRVYVSAEDGRVLAHRNSRWKLVDFLLMLHFMDYFRADHFNNPQIIAVGFGALWLAISGVLLVFYSFSRNDFRWLPGVASRKEKVDIVARAEGQLPEELSLDSSFSLLASLRHKGIILPSNCDGSGSCGLCRIRYEDRPPGASGVDREWIGATKLARGERLACQHKPRSGDAVVVPETAFQVSVQWGEIITCRWLTPLLKEISFRPDTPIDYSPGEYFQFEVPAADIRRDQMQIPVEFVPTWAAMSLPDKWHIDETHSRTYSVATAPGQGDSLAFTVRFFPPPRNTEHPPGIGSSYLCSLRPGDRIAFRGPGGDFQLIDSEREKILIGGGAGMAPLKSMVLHLLENRGWEGKLRFWYGARNQQEILYRETFESLAEEHPNFDWGVALSDAEEEESWVGERGFIHQVVHDTVLAGHDNLLHCEFYLCGPPLMLSATRAMLRDLGVSDELIRFDDFGN